MSILEAYCTRCMNKAGKNGFECDRCAKLPHAKLIYDADAYPRLMLAECPHCGYHNRTMGSNLELCMKCKKEFVSLDTEE